MAKNLDRVIDTKAFLKSIRPDEPPVSRKKAEADEQAVEPQKEETAEVETKKQVPLTKEEMQAKDEKYARCFIKPASGTSRNGKLTYVREEYRDRIDRIVHVIGKKGISIAGYVDHVLTQHFEEYEDSIHRLYKKNYKDVY